MRKKVKPLPPPSIGWWPIGTSNSTTVRWWNGKWWSITCRRTDTIAEVARFARIKSMLQDPDWAPRPANWPARSCT